MNKFLCGAAMIAALSTGLAASPSFANGMSFTVSTPDTPCGVIMVFGDNNNVSCDASNNGDDAEYSSDDASDDEAAYDGEPAYQPRRWAPACVTPVGNFRMQERLSYHVTCWVPSAGVGGWTGNADDNFFFPPLF